MRHWVGEPQPLPLPPVWNTDAYLVLAVRPTSLAVAWSQKQELQTMWGEWQPLIQRKETLDVCQSIHGDAEGNYGSALKNLGNVNTCCLANVSFARSESSTLIVFCK